jgi:hypothetical protein
MRDIYDEGQRPTTGIIPKRPFSNSETATRSTNIIPVGRSPTRTLTMLISTEL